MNEIIYILNKKAFTENFKRIESGKKLDIRNKPYNIELIENMIKFFENEEEFEKCNILLGFKNEMLDHENRYNK